MRFISVFFLLSFSYFSSIAQSPEIDVQREILLAELDRTEEDSSRIDLLLKIADLYRFKYPDSTYKYTVKAQKILTNSPDKLRRARTNLYMAWYHFIRGEYNECLEQARSGMITIEGIQGAEKIRVDLLRAEGAAFGSLGNYDRSLEAFYETLRLYELLMDENGVNIALNNIGVIYLKLEQFEKALDIFLQLEETIDLTNPASVTIPVNLGFIYFELNDFEQAKEWLYQALNFNGKIDIRAYGLSYFKLAQIFQLERDFDMAITYFNRSIAYYEELGNELENVQSFNGLATAYLENGDIDNALTYANIALETAERYDALPQKKESLFTLYQIAKQQNDPVQALAYHEAFKVISDSLQNAVISDEVGRLAAEYDFQKREQELVAAKEQSELLSEAKITQQRFYLIGAITIIIFAGLAIFGIQRNYRQKKESNLLLSKKNDEIRDQAEKLRQSNMVKDRIFSMIAHDLRGPLSSLYGVISLIEMNKASKEDLDEMMPMVTKRFMYTSTLLNNLLQWAQSQMDGYRVVPDGFDMTALLEEKRQLLQTKIDEKKISLNLPTQEHFVYADSNMIDLVVQNLISNAIKFCHVHDTITISIHSENEMAHIKVTDTGIGIKEEKLAYIFSDQFYTTLGTMNERGTGLGLMLCKEFVEKNGGTIWVNSVEGEGSTFTFTLPYPND